ncbi:MAG: hypothetical protein ACOYLX_02790 [Burkholderiaceae bacterium]
MEHADTHDHEIDADFPETQMMQIEEDEPAEVPNSLTAILDPAEALAAARRMQRWYQSSPQGASHSLFGRDGCRVEGRPLADEAADA